jgi:hypothetical protein
MFGDSWLLYVVAIALVYCHKFDLKKQFRDVSLFVWFSVALIILIRSNFILGGANKLK